MASPLDGFGSSVTSTAVAVKATEVVVFSMERLGFLAVLRHIRPGEADAAVRERAITAFRELVGRCLDEGKDGTIRVSEADGIRLGEQFCLVTLARRFGRVVGAAAFIVRCHDQMASLRRLGTVQNLLEEFRNG